MEQIPFVVFESVSARDERIIKRLILIVVVSLSLFFISNALWLYAWMQYDYSSSASTQTVTVDGKDGVANYIGNDGEITNGTDSGSESNSEEIKSTGAEECDH